MNTELDSFAGIDAWWTVSSKGFKKGNHATEYKQPSNKVLLKDIPWR